MTADRTRRGQPLGKGILGRRVVPSMKASGEGIEGDPFRG